MSLIYLLAVNWCFSQTDSVDIYDLDFEQLSQLKISTASKVLQKLEEVPSTVFVVTKEEIQNRGYLVFEDLLADLPGFQFRNIQGINTYSFQRGIPNQNNLILVLIDGIQINELNSGGFYGGGQYNLSNIERVEIIYGPASVAYGTNAVSGIVNIITKKIESTTIDADIFAGNFKTLSANTNFSYLSENNKLGVRFAAMYKQTEKANLKGNAGDNNWTDEMDNFEKDYSFDLKVKYNKFLFGTNYLQKQSSGATYKKSVGTIYQDHGTLWNIRFVNSYLKYQQKILKKINFESTLYNRNATVIDNSVLYIVDTAQIAYYRPNNLTGLENIFNVKKTNYSISGGVIFEYESLAQSFSVSVSDSPNETPVAPLKPKMENNFLASVFVEPEITLFNNFLLSGGLRYDYSTIYNHVLTPRGGLIYKFKDQIFRVSYSEAFRAPKPWDYTDGLGNNDLLPEKMRSYETGLVFSILKKYKLGIVGYSNTLQEAITRQDETDGYRWVNVGEINTTGIELSLKILLQKFKVNMNYTYTNSKDENDKTVFEISNHTANANITYQFNDKLKFYVGANYVGERKNPQLITSTNTDTIDPYIIINGAFSFIDYKNFDFQIIARNILNQEYYHTSNRDVERFRQSQRTVLLKIAYKFNFKTQ